MKIDQLLHFAKQVEEWVAAGERFAVETRHRMEQTMQYFQQLASVQDIESWNDAVNWYNNSLYMEQRTLRMLGNPAFTIGDKSYNWSEIDRLANDFDEEVIRYWEGEFGEEERREMWLRMGLTPANYAYVAPLRQKVRDDVWDFFASKDAQNEWYVRNMVRNKDRMDRLARDKDLPEDHPEKLTEKQIQQLMLESSMETNKVLNDVAMNQARMLQMMATEKLLENAPPNIPEFVFPETFEPLPPLR